MRVGNLTVWPMRFLNQAREQLKKELKIGNVHAVPMITRVVVNAGVGQQKDNPEHLKAVEKDLQLMTGQKPQVCRARQAVSGFSVRRGDLVGYRVTLRGKRMEDFISRFVGATLPRVRDFRGLPLSSLDGHGNLNVGLEEQLSFPEIRPEKTDVVFGVQVTFVTNTQEDAKAVALFRALGFPLTEKR